jgi:putative ABC transport system permease protein
MAVRLAIGGTPNHVLGLIVRHVSGVVGIGISLGLAGALTAARSMRGLLFGIEPWDPLSQTATIAVLGLVAVAAAWIPTRRAMRLAAPIPDSTKRSNRASRIDPAEVLRDG